MSRLPIPGQDHNIWGEVLNEYLSQAHNTDGTLKAIPQSKVTNLESDLSTLQTITSQAQTDASAALTTAQQAASATIADGSVTTTKLAAGAVTKTKLETTVQASLTKADSALQAADVSAVATSGSYNDLADKPSFSVLVSDTRPVSPTLGLVRIGAAVGGSSAAPVANFSTSSVSGTTPFTVTFTDTSSNVPTGWQWDFGDSSTSAVQNPVHTFENEGDFTVTLTATNSQGSSTKSVTVSVLGNAQTVPTLGTISLYDASSLTAVANGGTIETWNDTFGLNNLTAYGSPTKVASGPNGQPYVSFNGVDQYAENTALAGTATATEIVVARFTGTGGGTIVNVPGTGPRAIAANSSVWTAYNGTTVATSRAVNANEWVVLTYTYPSGSFRVNGTSKFGSAGSNVRTGVRFARSNGTSGTYSAINVAYARFYNRALSTEEIAQAEQVLASRFGISL